MTTPPPGLPEGVSSFRTKRDGALRSENGTARCAGPHRRRPEWHGQAGRQEGAPAHAASPSCLLPRRMTATKASAAFAQRMATGLMIACTAPV